MSHSPTVRNVTLKIWEMKWTITHSPLSLTESKLQNYNHNELLGIVHKTYLKALLHSRINPQFVRLVLDNKINNPY